MIGRFLKFMLAAVLVASGVAKAAETKLSLTMDKVPAQQLVTYCNRLPNLFSKLSRAKVCPGTVCKVK